MLSLIKRLDIDVLKLVNSYNHYTKLDLEYFKFLHKEALSIVLSDLKCFFYFCDVVLPTFDD